MRLAAPLAALFLAVPALAQDDGPQGIAFAQAEEGTWLCRDGEPLEAMQCAREHCAEQAPGQECYTTAWCFPAGWSGYMTIWLPDFHTTQVLCGVATEAALTDAFRALCAAEDTAPSCTLMGIIDPDGNERLFAGESFPGGAAPPPPEAPAEAEAGGVPDGALEKELDKGVGSSGEVQDGSPESGG